MARETDDGKAGLDATPFGGTSGQPLRLYQKVAKEIVEQLQAGEYAIGDRIPAERELAKTFAVSRPVVREALLALEVLGLIEVRVGSGAYVVKLNGSFEPSKFSVTPFELVEARMLIEGEAAALAAAQITDSEIAELVALSDAIADENSRPDGKEDADKAFHLAIARATRNQAIERAIEDLWLTRSTSPECALLLEKARTANVRPVVVEHTIILDALRQHDPVAARSAMRAHLKAVSDHLLFAIEADAEQEAGNSLAETRERFARSETI